MEPIDVTLSVTVAPEAGRPPPECRLKAWLKAGLRQYGIRAAWAPPAPGATQSDDPDAGRVTRPPNASAATGGRQ